MNFILIISPQPKDARDYSIMKRMKRIHGRKKTIKEQLKQKMAISLAFKSIKIVRGIETNWRVVSHERSARKEIIRI